MYADYDFEFDNKQFDQEAASTLDTMREVLGRVRGEVEPLSPTKDSDALDQDSFEVEVYEHQWISAFFAMVLYFGGSIAVIAALLMLFSPATFGSLIGSALAFVSGIGNLFHDIGILIGLH